MRIQVLKAACMKMTAFWDIVPWARALMMEAVCMSETSANLKETTRRYIPEGCYPEEKDRSAR
jgi:hypothetical protein